MLGFGCRDFIYLSRSLKRTPDLLLWSWCIYILGFVSLYLCLLTFPFCCFEGDESTLLKSPSSSHLQSMYNVIIFLKLRAKAPNMSSWCCSCVVFMCAVTYVLFWRNPFHKIVTSVMGNTIVFRLLYVASVTWGMFLLLWLFCPFIYISVCVRVCIYIYLFFCYSVHVSHLQMSTVLLSCHLHSPWSWSWGVCLSYLLKKCS